MNECCKHHHESLQNENWNLGCTCSSCHSSKEHIENNESKIQLAKIISGGILFATGIILGFIAKIPEGWPINALDWVRFALIVISFAITGSNVIFAAIKNITKGKIFDENFLMTIASVGAFIIGEFPEAAAVMLFYQVGEWFQEYAVGKSRRSISALMKLRPDTAFVIDAEGIHNTSAEFVKVGSLIEVKPGERIPLDGIIEAGTAFLDTSALTGESVPRKATVGDEVLGGFINTSGLLHIRTTQTAKDSAIARVLQLVEQAGSKKAVSERFITRFAKVYTPIVTIFAFGLAIIPPLVIPNAQWGDWFYRALIFLVVSCPCALVISVPLGFFGGIGAASRKGILIKGSSFLESLANAKIIVLDKTGTLTKGIFSVSSVHMAKNATITPNELLAIAAHGEKYSNHPISLSLRQAHQQNQSGDSNKVCDCCQKALLSNVNEISGQGISGILDHHKILIGNNRLMKESSVQGFGFEEYNSIYNGTIVHVAIDKKYVGHIVISDQIKPEAKEAISCLKKQGVKEVVMLTGDTHNAAKKVGLELGIDEVYAELMPEDKVYRLEQLLATKKSPSEKLIFVGDGVNDAPVLARSDIGIAMGTNGSDAAIEAADVIIMTDELTKLSESVEIARKTQRIVMQNIIFALSVKILVMGLGAIGIANMWAAVFADVGVSCLAVFNSMRQLIKKR